MTCPGLKALIKWKKSSYSQEHANMQDDDKPSACACAKSKETKRNETKPGSVVPSEASKASNNVVHVHVYNSA